MAEGVRQNKEGFGERSMYSDEYNSIKTDVELLKRDVSTNHSLYSKIDSAIEKMAEVSNTISKMLIIHENKLENHAHMLDAMRDTLVERKQDLEKQILLIDARFNGLRTDIDSDRRRMHQEVMAAIKELGGAHKELDERLNILERWKWYVLGVAATIGFVLSQLPRGLSAILSG